MTTDIAITVEHNEFRLAGTLGLLNTGTGNAGFWLFGNTRAASVNDAPGAAPLATILLDDPAGVIGSGVLTLTPGDDALVSVSGVALWARCFNGDGDTVFDCDVSDSAGTATVKLPSTSLFAGGVTRLFSGVLG